jgi:hypothetical protein
MGIESGELFFPGGVQCRRLAVNPYNILHYLTSVACTKSLHKFEEKIVQ